MPDSALPPNLRGKKHNDYPWWLRWIPRSLTAFNWGKPIQVRGSLKGRDIMLGMGDIEGYVVERPKPISKPGTWQISTFPDGPWFAWYFAFTTKGGTHFRIGARWDNVDGYVEFPSIAVKRGIR